MARNTRGNTSRRRQLIWGRFELNNTETTLVARDLLSGYESEMGVTHSPGITIMRIRGTLNYMATTPADALAFLDMGIAVFEDSQASSSAPNPGSDSYDWMWLFHDGYTTPAHESSAVPLYVRQSRRIEVDVKSKRKIDGLNKSLFVVINVSDSMQVNFQGSILLALP